MSRLTNRLVRLLIVSSATVLTIGFECDLDDAEIEIQGFRLHDHRHDDGFFDFFYEDVYYDPYFYYF